MKQKIHSLTVSFWKDMLTTKESASPTAAADSEITTAASDGGEMEAAPDGESDGEDAGERPNPTAVESADDLGEIHATFYNYAAYSKVAYIVWRVCRVILKHSC